MMKQKIVYSEFKECREYFDKIQSRVFIKKLNKKKF